MTRAHSCLAAIALILATGCPNSGPPMIVTVDPCATESGACVAVQFTGSVQIDTIRLQAHSAAKTVSMDFAPATLPSAVAVTYMADFQGPVTFIAYGLSHTKVVAMGSDMPTLLATGHSTITINLVAASTVCSTGTDIDCGGTCMNKCAVGKNCQVGSDCDSNVCTMGLCTSSSCTDKVQNGDETDVDCGGGMCPSCDDGKLCAMASDCMSGVCSGAMMGKTCQIPTCSDGIKNHGESDTDCGAVCPMNLCDNGKICLAEGDCKSAVCTQMGTNKICQAGECNDGKMNGQETDIDCGGPTCAACGVGKQCKAGTDCIDKICGSNMKCSAATCSDQIKNEDETDVDCGGMKCAPCADGKSCATGTDCVDKVCTMKKCALPSCTDGLLNGNETDLNCGGGPYAGLPACPKCPDMKMCKMSTDCSSGHCNVVCISASCTDGVQNGDETDVDCGGSCGPCKDQLHCKVAKDCTSKICSSAMKCAVPTCSDSVQNGNETDVDCGGLGYMGAAPCSRCGATKMCGSSPDCVATATCSSGMVCKTNQGSNCAADAECATGNCVDTVCCNVSASQCGGTGAATGCKQCNLTGSPGVCTNIPNGSQAPAGHAQCTASVTTCQLGTCNGAGNCNATANTPCGSPMCSTAMLTTPLCDASASCKMMVASCMNGFACNGQSACYSSCTDDTACQTPAYFCGTTSRNCLKLDFKTATLTNLPAGGANAVAIAAADLDGDSKADLVTANQSTNNFSTILTKGTNANYTFAGVNSPAGIAIGDLNGAGGLDVVMTNGGNNTVVAFLGATDGTFTAVNSAGFVLASPKSVTIGDFDGDNVTDAMIANSGTNKVTFCKGQNNGTFACAQNIPLSGNPSSVAAGEFDGDTKLDFAAAYQNVDQVGIVKNTGGGGYSEATVTVASQPVFLVAADVTGDGKLDLIVASKGASAVTAFVNNGSGVFTAATATSVGTGTLGVAVGDFDGDGKADFAAIDAMGDRIYVFHGKNDGTFIDGHVYMTGSSTATAIVAADIDGNGKSDVAVANGTANNVSVLLNAH